MPDTTPYKKTVTWGFMVFDEHVAITTSEADYVYLEDTRKNGQEDTHIYAGFERKGDGKWILSEDDPKYEHIMVQYWGRSYVDAIIKHLETHGPPKE